MGESDPLATFSYVARELGRRKLAFLCAREALGDKRIRPQLKNTFGGAYLANEQFTATTRNQILAAGGADAVAYGMPFIANPDLPERFRQSAALNAPDQKTFYALGPKVYTDYPFLKP